MEILYNMYCNATGYSVSSQDYVMSLLGTNECKIKLQPVNQRFVGISKSRLEWIDSLRKTEISDNYISIQQCIPPVYSQFKKHKNIGIAVFETIDPPKSWITNTNKMDLILFPSHFNKNTFISAGLKTPSEVIPHCFDVKLFNDKVKPKGRYNRFTFMYIATYRQRKNFDELINGYYDAFSDSDNVCLIIKTDKAKQLNGLILSIKSQKWRSKNTSPIYLDDQIIDFEEIPSYMKKADVVISPSRGEGFNIPCLHALALKVPVIVTRYGGCLEYSKPEYVTYFEPSEYKRQPNIDNLPQFHNKIWAEVKAGEIRDKLVYAFNNYAELTKKTDIAYAYVHENYNYESTGKLFLEVFKKHAIIS